MLNRSEQHDMLAQFSFLFFSFLSSESSQLMDVDRHKTFYVHFNDHNIELIATHYLKNPLLMSPCDIGNNQIVSSFFCSVATKIFEDLGGTLCRKPV